MFRHVKGYARLIVLALVMGLISAGFKVILPVIIQYSVDTLISGHPSEQIFLVRFVPSLMSALVFILSIKILEGFFRYLSRVIKGIAVEQIGERLRNQMYDRIQYFSFRTHSKMTTGDLVQRCTSDVETYLEFFRTQLDEISRIILLVTVSIVIMLKMNILLTLVPVAVVPFITLFSYIFHKKIHKIFEKVDKQEAVVTNIAQESISGIRVVKAFGTEPYEVERYSRENNDLYNKYLVMGKNFSKYYSFSSLLGYIQVGGTLFVGGLMAIEGRITVGTLLAFMMYCEWLSFPLKMLGRAVTQMSKAFVSAGRINDVLDTKIDTEDGKETPEIHGEIIFDHVSFSYDNDDVLKNISFTLKAGETLGILGMTGSGKTTLVQLLLRLYDYRGSITIDGVELRDIKKSYIRNSIGLVMQDPYLFSKTIRENINITQLHEEDEIVHAAHVADIHSDIVDFSDEYETVVGERGAQLSGGQQQRLAIARTIIGSDKKILIFDDSLSAVDSETDQSIRHSLSELQREATKIIISHRVNTVMNADKIVVLADGEIQSIGTHEELKDADGLYGRLCKVQSEFELE